jgi:penicillin amidase
MAKLILRTSFAILATAGILSLLVIGVIKGPLPQRAGTIELSGLRADVRVEFDERRVPHINAANRADAFLALGFVTAGDRLFQMDLLRRQPAGRLAEIFGAGLVEEDRWNRIMGFNYLAPAILARLPAPQREVLSAYAAGVNQAMEKALLFPVEFTLLGYRPEPWCPEDSILVMLAMHAMLSWSEEQERTASVMRKALPLGVVELLTPQNDCYNDRLSASDSTSCGTDRLPLAELAVVLEEAERKGLSGAGSVSAKDNPRGSNGWVVGPAKASGRAIVANDMHLKLGVPNIWYQAELTYPGARLMGLTLPGVPALVVGSNGRLAWGITSIEGDFTDLVTLESDPDSPNHYLTPDGLRAFDTRRETISVRDGPDETLDVKTTIWGPVLPEPLLGKSVAARWTALDPEATDLVLLDLDEAATVEAAIVRFNEIGIPPVNILLADDTGNIGWTYAGKIPRRIGMNGLFSESWADGRKGWDGYVAPKDMPRLVNPPENFLVNANQRMLGSGLSKVIGHDFSGGYRAWRIAGRLREASNLSEEDMLALQLDTETEFYRYYQRIALQALEGDESQGPLAAQELRRYLEAWDGRAEPESLGLPLLVKFREDLIEAVLEPILAKCRAIDPTFTYHWSAADLPVQRLIDSGRIELLPDRRSFRNWNEFLRTILYRSAQALLQQEFVGTLDELSWGKVSKVNIRHPMAEAVEGLGLFLDMPARPLPGCPHCVRLADGAYGASERMVISPGHESDGILHMPGGQSGQPGSAHYADQQDDWLMGSATPFFAPGPLRSLTLKARP